MFTKLEMFIWYNSGLSVLDISTRSSDGLDELLQALSPLGQVHRESEEKHDQNECLGMLNVAEASSVIGLLARIGGQRGSEAADTRFAAHCKEFLTLAQRHTISARKRKLETATAEVSEAG